MLWSKETEDYLERVKERLAEMKPTQIADHIENLVKANNDWRRRKCINMLASENVMSPRARALLDSDLALRVSEGPPGAKLEPGNKYVEEIEAIVIELSKKLFRAKHVEWRPLTGTMVNAVVFFALTKPGDVIMSHSMRGGGNVSYRKFGVAGLRGLKVKDFPVSGEDMGIDVSSLKKEAKKTRPKLFVVGGSIILFPYPVREIRSIADEIGAYVMYDGAHVGPLIASRIFQDPFGEGADVVQVNTHKMMAGPIGGLALCNEDDIAEKIHEAAWPGLIGTRDCNKYAALAYTLAEMVKFGEDYARQIVANAKALARALDEEGFNVMAKSKGYTMSHQVLLDVRKLGGGDNVENALINANIICTKMQLPWDSETYVPNPSGIRLGVQEITRQGMKEKEMKEVARLMGRVAIAKEEPSKIASEIEEFLKDFQEIKYCFA